VAQLSPNVVRIASRALTVTPAMREAMRALLDAEYAAARAMGDDVFWGYDSAWLGLGSPELVDVRRAGAGGGGGANMSWNNNQFWKLAQECDRGLFTLVMYQQRRYIAAQIRIARHLANVPQLEVLLGLDKMPSLSNVREACSGVHPKDRAQDWAYWCEEAVRLIGAARWASNFTWSDSSRTCGDATYRIDAQPIVGPYDTGCRYQPDCATDPYGVPRLGYVAGKAPDGIARWEGITRPQPSAQLELVNAARAWPISWDAQRERAERQRMGQGLPWGFGASWPVSISPSVLGLHSSSRTVGQPLSIPQGAQAFNGAWAGGSMRGTWPPFLQPDEGEGLGDRLFALFLENPAGSAIDDAEGYVRARNLRERTGCWYWKYEASSGGASGIATNLAYPVPASELVIWRLVAQLRDILALPFGQVVIDGFTNLDRAVQGIPVEFRGNLDAVAAQVRSAANAVRAEQADVIGGAFSAAGAGAAAINPVAGIVVGLMGALTSALVRFSIDIGLARGSNPPALQMPAARVAPPTISGDDRCWVNPGELEALEQYRARVTAPYAEAAQRSGGDPGRLFDIIPEVRFQQFCQQNPGAPECQVQPPATSSPWAKYLLGVGGSAAGYLAIKLLGG
jgi:hypothetical protein